MKKLLILIPFIIGCKSQINDTHYQDLLEYEGHYEYIGETTLDLLASELDTNLYAVIDKAKYPLKHIGLDSFVDNQGSLVTFERDKNDDVQSYKADGQNFKLISKDFGRLEMVPRKALLHNPDAYSYKKPVEIQDGLKTGDLNDEFKNPELIINMIQETIKGNHPDVHSILIYKNDRLILEEYFYGYDINTPHQLRSATKPFIGGILGIAIDKGFIKSEKESVLPFFMSKYKQIANLDSRKEKLSIENVLMFRHGLDCENDNPESKGNEQSMMQSDDWVKFTLDLPTTSKAGVASSYCTGCALVIGRLVELSTGEKIEDFAKENLFDPMGITNYDWTFEPNKASTTTFSQMTIRPRDLVKLAKMYKDGGKWNGQQILSEKWVNKTFDMEEGDYGYLWQHKYFVLEGRQYNSYLATGNGGQKINIWPELDMITVFTGGNYNSYALYGKSTPPNYMIPTYILQAIE